jgi:membrane associated rhomboid family serine protease
MSARKEEYSLFYSFLPGLLLTGLMWLVTILANVYGHEIGKFGIYPGKLSGLAGVFITPFLHKDFVHLLSNTFPFLILSAMIFYSYRKVSVWVLAGSIIITGLATWLLARPAYHIGASGVVYAMASFLLFSGVFRRDRSSGAISFVIMFLYSSMLYGIFPSDEKISWESHALGGFTGLLLAFVFRHVNRPAQETLPAQEDEEIDFETQLLAWQQQQQQQQQMLQTLPDTGPLAPVQDPAGPEPAETGRPDKHSSRVSFSATSSGQTLYRYIYQPEAKPEPKK